MGAPQEHRAGAVPRRAAVAAVALLLALSGSVVDPVEAQTTEAVTSWLHVDAGLAHTCAIATTHALYCWGSNAFGALGTGGGNSSSPVPVAGGFADWSAVSAGDLLTCGIRDGGHLFCWGSDAFGGVGDGGGHQDRAVPTEVAGSHGPWASVSVGGDVADPGGGAACAVTVSGHGYCWGSRNGIVGDGGGFGTTTVNAPVELAGAASNWASVSVGIAHACGRKSTGRLFCWGQDFAGQVGDGATRVNRVRPVAVANGGTGWASVSAGWNHTCATRRSGRLFCWGSDDHFALGNGDQNAVDQTVPTQVRGATTDWTAPATGGNHTCGRRTSGRLYCWGWNISGQIGHPVPGVDVTRPVRVSGGFTDWAAVVAGESHTCGLRAGGALYCWGRNSSGAVGNGTTDFVNVPVPIAG